MHKTCKIMNSTCDMLIHKLSLFIRSFSCVFFFILVVQLVICIITFLILSELSFFLVYARHMRSATLTFKSFSQLVISFARFWASMLSSFIDVSLCSVDATHMHRRGFDDQMWIFFCDLALCSWHMLRIGFEAFSTRRQVLNVRDICNF